MRILERTLIILTLIGLLLKVATLNLWGDILLTTGLTLLAVFYFTLGFAVFNGIALGQIFKGTSYAGLSRWRVFAAIGLGIFTSMILVGIVFKMLHLAGAGQNILLGATGLIILIVSALIRYLIKKRRLDSFYKSVFIMGPFLLVLAVASIYTKSATLVAFFHRDDPKYIELYNNMIADPQNEQAWEEFVEYAGKK